MHIRNHKNSVAKITVPVTAVHRMFSQAPVFLVFKMRRQLVPTRSPNKPFSVASAWSSYFLFLLQLSYLSARRWSELENTPPVMANISSALAHLRLTYFLFSDVTRLRSPITDLLSSILPISHMFCETDIFFSEKNMRHKGFLDYLFHSCKRVPHLPDDVL